MINDWGREWFAMIFTAQDTKTTLDTEELG